MLPGWGANDNSTMRHQPARILYGPPRCMGGFSWEKCAWNCRLVRESKIHKTGVANVIIRGTNCLLREKVPHPSSTLAHTSSDPGCHFLFVIPAGICGYHPCWRRLRCPFSSASASLSSLSKGPEETHYERSIHRHCLTMWPCQLLPGSRVK